MTSSQFTQWCGYYDAYPWDMGFALLAALLGNIYRDKKTNPSPFSIKDFVPGLVERDKEDTDPGDELFIRLGRDK